MLPLRERYKKLHVHITFGILKDLLELHKNQLYLNVENTSKNVFHKWTKVDTKFRWIHSYLASNSFGIFPLASIFVRQSASLGTTVTQDPFQEAPLKMRWKRCTLCASNSIHMYTHISFARARCKEGPWNTDLCVPTCAPFTKSICSFRDRVRSGPPCCIIIS